ncbi:GL24347 [Drosophila persimilis]|uniref:GL24347 n=1 Tax=Drosophila persimilis TaxID=7234 RepID=B4G5F3_DROPE|nr:GL24347 [Drosophila persimilis]
MLQRKRFPYSLTMLVLALVVVVAVAVLRQELGGASRSQDSEARHSLHSHYRRRQANESPDDVEADVEDDEDEDGDVDGDVDHLTHILISLDIVERLICVSPPLMPVQGPGGILLDPGFWKLILGPLSS